MELGDQANAGEIQERASVQHFLILGHPDPRSFNHAIAARYAEIVQTNYQSVVVRDLYAIGFDPLLKDIERPQRRPGFYSHDVMIEIDLIERSDVVTFVYPLWFGTPPAIIKGYIDRVFGAAFMLSDLKRLCAFSPRPRAPVHGSMSKALYPRFNSPSAAIWPPSSASQTRIFFMRPQ
jgi:NAD(P)H-dependent FMN reductase